jgi:hypothetical protein
MALQLLLRFDIKEIIEACVNDQSINSLVCNVCDLFLVPGDQAIIHNPPVVSAKSAKSASHLNTLTENF